MLTELSPEFTSPVSERLCPKVQISFKFKTKSCWEISQNFLTFPLNEFHVPIQNLNIFAEVKPAYLDSHITIFVL